MKSFLFQRTSEGVRNLQVTQSYIVHQVYLTAGANNNGLGPNSFSFGIVLGNFSTVGTAMPGDSATNVLAIGEGNITAATANQMTLLFFPSAILLQGDYLTFYFNDITGDLTLIRASALVFYEEIQLGGGLGRESSKGKDLGDVVRWKGIRRRR